MKQYQVRLCGVNCRVEEYGDPEATPILMLHGWLDNLASFKPLIKYLSNYRLIAIDFPGHGHSDHLPPGMAYHFLDLVYVIQDAVEFFQLESLSIIGHSMGGAAATLYTSVASKVEKLILIEALGPLTVSADGTFELMQRSINDRQLIKHKRRSIYTDAEQAIEIRAKHSNIQPEVIRPVVERGVESVDKGVRWRSDPRLTVASINRLTEQQLEPLLKQIQCPVLLIEAEKGLFSENPVIQKRKEFFGKLTTELLSGGHHVHMEKPKKTAELILKFLDSTKLTEDTGE